MKIELNLRNQSGYNSAVEFHSQKEYLEYVQKSKRTNWNEIPFGNPVRYPCLMIFNDSFICSFDKKHVDKYPALYLYEGEYKIGE